MTDLLTFAFLAAGVASFVWLLLQFERWLDG